MAESQTITAMEKQAIADTKRRLHDALVAIGSPNAFDEQNAANIEYLIWEIWGGLRASMQRQSAAGDIPF